MDTINSVLSFIALSAIIDLHYKKYKIYPTTLCVPPENTELAYKAIKELSLHYMIVVPIPGLPIYSWFVCSPKGLIYSEIE